MKRNYRLISLIGLAGAMLSVNAMADDAINIENAGSSGTASVTYDNYSGSYPVVSAILTSPQILDGYTYKTYGYFASDGTASLDIYQPTSASAYVPTLGAAISATGPYALFDSLPELSPTTVTLQSTGNAYASPTTVTIPQIDAAPAANGVAQYGGYLVTLDNVTITGAPATFPTHANGTYGVTDGVNSMVLYFWASSYSTDGALGGTTVPTGLVDITGWVDYYTPSSEAEFIPTSFTPVSTVPEPSLLNLCGIGSGLAYVVSRLRKKA